LRSHFVITVDILPVFSILLGSLGVPSWCHHRTKVSTVIDAKNGSLFFIDAVDLVLSREVRDNARFRGENSVFEMAHVPPISVSRAVRTGSVWTMDRMNVVACNFWLKFDGASYLLITHTMQDVRRFK
jgi:hypothetical protein